MVKNPLVNAGDVRDGGSILGLGRSPGGGHGNPLQHSCLENPMDRGAWRAIVEEVYKKDLHDTDNHDGVITHLEPDILECKVKWALGSITANKASRGDGI